MDTDILEIKQLYNSYYINLRNINYIEIRDYCDADIDMRSGILIRFKGSIDNSSCVLWFDTYKNSSNLLQDDQREEWDKERQKNIEEFTKIKDLLLKKWHQIITPMEASLGAISCTF